MELMAIRQADSLSVAEPFKSFLLRHQLNSSREGKQLGDKRTLEQQVHEITGIAISALQGSFLSEFSVTERMLYDTRQGEFLFSDFRKG
jgi:hypothetical protein